jgi:hypothetical protein
VRRWTMLVTSAGRRVGRVLFALLAITSSLVSVGALIGWMRSYEVEDRIIWERPQGDSWIAASCRGRIMLGRSLYPGVDGSRRRVPIGLHHYSAPVWSTYTTRFALDPFRTRVLDEGAPAPAAPRQQFYYSPNGYYLGKPFHDTYYDHGAFHTYFDNAGFAYQSGMLRSLNASGQTISTVVTSRFVLAPCWALALASSIAPALWTWCHFLRRRKSHAGSGFEVSPATVNRTGGSKGIGGSTGIRRAEQRGEVHI